MMIKITIAQLNPTIGDFRGNLGKIELTLQKVKIESPDLVLFPEMFLTGYPPRDLLEEKDFLIEAEKSLVRLTELSRHFPGITILCGTVIPTRQNVGKGLHNSAVLVRDGEVVFQQHKSLLPTYDVFDEERYFDPSSDIETCDIKDEKLGVTICEDAWNEVETPSRRTYAIDPIAILAQKGASVFINISASPFCDGKETIRHRLIRNHVRKYRKPFVVCNQIGGNDELIFDGRSMAFDGDGRLIALLPSFQEEIRTIDLGNPECLPLFRPHNRTALIYDALVLGIRDYMGKCGFRKAVLGLSGGIDSSLVCCLASDAVGPENVLGVSMPSPYTSQASMDDAAALARNLGVAFLVVPITPLFQAYRDSLKAPFEGTSEDITEENIQARIRGNILMALSNKFGHLTLSPGNKSELSVGYCTLYGDMSGGLSVLADVPKTMVYSLARLRNRHRETIPASVFTKAPSAELKPNQKDQDTLPPYEILDRILTLALDRGFSKEEIIQENLDPATVAWVIQAVAKSEYKRRQAAPGLKVTTKAFGSGRRMPIAAAYPYRQS